MTTHYSDTLTAKEIVTEWRRNGEAMPGAYALLSKGDCIAYSCWTYLEWKQTHPEATVKDWSRNVSKENKQLYIDTIKEVLDILDS